MNTFVHILPFLVPCPSLCQDKEHELSLQRERDEQQRILQEKEGEMMMAIEERELQKMAAVSAQDNQKDELQRIIDSMKSVSQIRHLFRFLTLCP